ncbi:Mitogen-activated protein kinase kinase kinase 7 [Chamberlinius hualienensis]
MMNFVEEIEFTEIEMLEMVGKGSFGVVSKAKWRDKIVAVKMINSELERKAFLVELRQLSRVNHPNIVKLYGACQSKPVCLVMEYAEGGSLYNVLHGNAQPEYTAAHAISWALQCSRGVAYLHGMKPKALIHRDLKPPNLLLIMGGTVLKICDFGTACDIQTHMTNNKGSAAWMAPEVFEGSNYSEKCDVFSWGIILWEVISRQKPFDDIRGSAYQILWAVHSGKRPPLIRGCPKPLELLMNRCWAKEPHLRPSMDEVVNIMSHVFVFFKGSEQPIKYPDNLCNDSESDSDESGTGQTYNSLEVTNGSDAANQMVGETSGSDQSTQTDMNCTVGSSETLSSINLVLPTQNSRVSITSAPASLVGSAEDVRIESERTLENERSSINLHLNRLLIVNPDASIKTKPGHKRTGSDSTSYVQPVIHPLTSIIRNEDGRRKSHDNGTNLSEQSLFNIAAHSHGTTPAPVFHSVDGRKFENPFSVAPVPSNSSSAVISPSTPTFKPLEPSKDTIDNCYRLLETYLQPIAPQQNNRESLHLFEEHKHCAYSILKKRSELELIKQRKTELTALMGKPPAKNGLLIEFDNLDQEKESLQKLYENLQQQLAITRKQMQH